MENDVKQRAAGQNTNKDWRNTVSEHEVTRPHEAEPNWRQRLKTYKTAPSVTILWDS